MFEIMGWRLSFSVAGISSLRSVGLLRAADDDDRLEKEKMSVLKMTAKDLLLKVKKSCLTLKEDT